MHLTDIAQTFTVPLFLLVILDFPRRHPWIYQPWLLAATWVLADLLIIEMHRCEFFGPHPHCGTKNFINTLGFAFGQPTLAMLALRQNRLFAAIGAGQWLIVAGVLLLTHGTPTLFYRNIVNCEEFIVKNPN